MKLKKTFENIDFVNRYQNICIKYNDFDNRMRNSTKQLCKQILDEFDYNYKYISNGSFYQIKHLKGEILFQLHLVLKGGIIETLLFIEENEKTLEPQGRIDFFPEELGIPFERLKCGALPKYKSDEELKEILNGLFSIYEDLKFEYINQ
ncbi:hypothetical protein SHK09_15160 [Polaribacter sp. PL03]|uniref:hypothetical protein n=1 Tax=Polaribacter sp. PL03 TaxID=3088353 RepID=UPI0029CAD322|nr:hypothetical protein [Polaribacter sp. PL03]MDX6748135.1 hypothetical protein [Polaribacter sp. PL03]